MQSFTDLIQQSSARAWLFIPSAILLGAFHLLEPVTRKTMLAAFISPSAARCSKRFCSESRLR